MDISNDLSDLKLLDKLLNDDRLHAEKFIHETVDGLCGRKDISYSTAEYKNVLSQEEFDLLHSAIKSLIGTPSHALPKTLKDSSITGPGSSQAAIEIILKCLRVREGDVLKYKLTLVEQISGSVLTDFDWQVRLSVSSDKLSKLLEPLFVLQLSFDECGKRRSVCLEMDKTKLETLIEKLEEANESLTKL